jgi:hypothetical protein
MRKDKPPTPTGQDMHLQAHAARCNIGSRHDTHLPALKGGGGCDKRHHRRARDLPTDSHNPSREISYHFTNTVCSNVRAYPPCKQP